MARKPRDYHAEHLRRIARFEEKIGRRLRPGESRQAARGHRRGEHRSRAVNGKLTLSSGDRAFLRRQREKISDIRVPADDWSKIVATYRNLSRDARDEVRRIQRENQTYLRRKKSEARRRHQFVDAHGKPVGFSSPAPDIDENAASEELQLADILDENLTPNWDSENAALLFYH